MIQWEVQEIARDVTDILNSNPGAEAVKIGGKRFMSAGSRITALHFPNVIAHIYQKMVILTLLCRILVVSELNHLTKNLNSKAAMMAKNAQRELKNNMDKFKYKQDVMSSKPPSVMAVIEQ